MGAARLLLAIGMGDAETLMHRHQIFVVTIPLLLGGCAASSALPVDHAGAGGKSDRGATGGWVTLEEDVLVTPCGQNPQRCEVAVLFHMMSVPGMTLPVTAVELGPISAAPDDILNPSFSEDPADGPLRRYYRLTAEEPEASHRLSEILRFSVAPVVRVLQADPLHCRPLHALPPERTVIEGAATNSGRFADYADTYLRSVDCYRESADLEKSNWDRAIFLDYELLYRSDPAHVENKSASSESKGLGGLPSEKPLRVNIQRATAPASRDKNNCSPATDERHRKDRLCAWDPEGTIVADPDEWRADLRVAVTVVKEPIEQALDALDRRYTLDGYRGAEYHGAENSWDKPDGRVRSQSHPNNARFDVWDWTELGTDVELSPSGLTLQAMQEGRVFLEFSDVDSLGDELMNRCYFRLRGEGDDSEGYVEPIDGSDQYRAVCKAGTGLGGGDIVITLEIEPGD